MSITPMMQIEAPETDEEGEEQQVAAPHGSSWAPPRVVYAFSATAVGLVFLLVVARLSAPATQQLTATNIDGVTDLAETDASGCDGWDCENGCGRCFNPGGRPGLMCNNGTGQTGYYCPSDPGKGGDAAFACIDWTFGSTAMLAAEAAFQQRTQENVYLGVGTYGTSDDKQNGLGACYRLEVEGVDKHIIAQSINTGFDVAGNQFDLMIGAGGAGAYNSCAGAEYSIFPGNKAVWGCQYGGVRTREGCSKLPEYAKKGSEMKKAGDSLQKMCEYGFDKKVRAPEVPGHPCGANPTLLHVARVQCPDELVHLTQVQRKDDPKGYTSNVANSPQGKCANAPGTGTEYCLTRMMDCRKPSGGFIPNMHPELMVEGKKVVQPCTSDGYTRIDVRCASKHCYN